MSTSVNNRVSGKSVGGKYSQVDKTSVNTSQDKVKVKRSNSSSNRTKTKHSESSRFDTLDSAYSTSESSYNTVDSSYSQHTSSSGYNTLEFKWKDAKSDRRWNNDETKRLDYPSNTSKGVAIASDVIRGDVTSCGVAKDSIRFADDLDDSDTTTETETDTEQTIVGDSIDMSYVPDYIRPVSILPLSSAVAINNSNLPSPSSSSSNSTLTASSTKDEASDMPRFSHKKQDRNPPSAGYKYVKNIMQV